MFEKRLSAYVVELSPDSPSLEELNIAVINEHLENGMLVPKVIIKDRPCCDTPSMSTIFNQDFRAEAYFCVFGITPKEIPVFGSAGKGFVK